MCPARRSAFAAPAALRHHGHLQEATAFFNKTYDEAFALLVEARNYVEPSDGAAADMWGRTRISLETTRLTSRLGHVMAWRLARKAVHAGEISRETAGKPPLHARL